MSLLEIDWGHLRHGLLAPSLLLLACVAGWGATTLYESRVTAKLEAGQQSLAALETERDHLTDRREARRRFAQLFQELSVRGIVGPEQRLGWVQAMRDAGSVLQLPYLRYTTSPQQPFQADWLVPGETAPVLVSPVDLQLGLVHEVDLVRLVAQLRKAPGLMEVRSCRLEMLSADSAPQPDKANLTGSCQLNLYSIPREATLAAAGPES